MDFFDEPITFEDAEELIRKKGLMPTTLGSAQLRDLDQAIKLRSFFSAKMTDAQALDLAQKLTAKIAGGPDDADFAARAAGKEPLLMSIPEAKAQLLEHLKAQGYMPSEEDRGTLKDFSSDARRQLIVETNVLDAQGYGRHRALQNSSTLDAYPAQELVRMRFSKVPRDWEERWEAARDASSEEGSTSADSGRMVALVNHPIWQALGDGAGGYDDTLGNAWAPFAFNSGMNTISVSRDDAVELGICGEDTRIDPEEDEAAGGFNDGVEGSIEGYAEFIQDAIRAVKGLVVKGGVVTLGNGMPQTSSGVEMLRDNIGRVIGMLLPNMGTSDGAYKGWETRRGQRNAVAKDIKAVRRAMRIAKNQGRGTPEVLTRGKIRIDMDYGRPGNPEAGHGDGYGASHAESKHGEDLHRLPVTLARGSVHQHDSDPDKLIVAHGDHVAILQRQSRNDGGKSQTRYGFTTHYHDAKMADRARALPAIVEGR